MCSTWWWWRFRLNLLLPFHVHLGHPHFNGLFNSWPGSHHVSDPAGGPSNRTAYHQLMTCGNTGTTPSDLCTHCSNLPWSHLECSKLFNCNTYGALTYIAFDMKWWMKYHKWSRTLLMTHLLGGRPYQTTSDKCTMILRTTRSHRSPCSSSCSRWLDTLAFLTSPLIFFKVLRCLGSYILVVDGILATMSATTFRFPLRHSARWIATTCWTNSERTSWILIGTPCLRSSWRSAPKADFLAPSRRLLGGQDQPAASMVSPSWTCLMVMPL